MKEQLSSRRKKSKETSNSFEFTSFWADSNNKIIPDLVDFTKTFFDKHTILNILTKYCVFTSEDLLLVMRPYQTAGTERILNRIVVSTNHKKTGTKDAGGYIWHTTGERVIIVMGTINDLESRISGTLTKYNSCIA